MNFGFVIGDCGLNEQNDGVWVCLASAIANLQSAIEMASRPGAAPGKLNFGDSAALLVRDLFDDYKTRNSTLRIARSALHTGAAAGICTRTFYLAGRHSPFKLQPRNYAVATTSIRLFQSAIVNPQSEIESQSSIRNRKEAWRRVVSRPLYYNKEQTPLQGIFAVQPQVFRGGRFGVLGTPPPKPLNCKVWENLAGAQASHASHFEAL